jgi:hypothetical protein
MLKTRIALLAVGTVVLLAANAHADTRVFVQIGAPVPVLLRRRRQLRLSSPRGPRRTASSGDRLTMSGPATAIEWFRPPLSVHRTRARSGSRRATSHARADQCGSAATGGAEYADSIDDLDKVRQSFRLESTDAACCAIVTADRARAADLHAGRLTVHRTQRPTDSHVASFRAHWGSRDEHRRRRDLPGAGTRRAPPFRSAARSRASNPEGQPARVTVQ